MNSLINNVLNCLRSGNLSPAYECKEMLNEIALAIYNKPALLVPDIEDLKGIILICNICYNDTDREILPIEDGFYDVLLEKYKTYDPEFQVGAEVIKFNASTQSNQPYTQSNLINGVTFIEDEDKNREFLNDIVIDATKYIDYRDFEVSTCTITEQEAMTKRLHDTSHNHPELVGTLDKCKFVLSKDASERGCLNDSNVKTFERDFFGLHLKNGIINPSDIFDMVLELKYDGISVEADCTDEIVSARSRGDTGIGKASDLTPILKGYKFPHRSKNAPMIGVKFEAIIQQSDLYRFNIAKNYEYKNCRSAIVGLLSSSDSWKYRDFITLVPLAVEEKVYHEVCNSDRIQEINFLNREFVSKGCPLRHALVSGNYIENLAWVNIFTQSAEAMRYMVPFMYDGIVASYRDERIRQILGRENFINKYSIAVKFNPLKKETIFRGYSYTVGQDGSITPIINYDPVEFYGTIHTKSSGHSLAKFNELGLRLGNIISVEYVNDVMPYVSKPDIQYNQEIDSKIEPIQFPSVCPVCGSFVVQSDSGRSAKCINQDCGGRNLARMVNMCSKLELDGFGESTIIQIGCYHMKDLLELCLKDDGQNQLIARGFGPVESLNIINQLHKIVDEPLLISKLLGSIGFSSVSTKTWELILPHISYEELRKMLSIRDQSKFYWNRVVEILSSIKGIGPTIANIIATEFLYFRDDIDYVIARGNVVDYKGNTGIKICFSGFRDETLKNKLNQSGFNVVDNVTKDTKLLIVADLNSSSSKVVKAKSYNIPIAALQEFINDIDKFK